MGGAFTTRLRMQRVLAGLEDSAAVSRGVKA